jgi:4-diphosphocytidyl-2-C-methyl-D-erythritol kinase
MTALRDTAKAKLNLTLEVLGRRDDGYHEIRGLVAFAALGDGLELEPGQDLALAIDGPFAGALSGGNLVTAAAKAAKSREPAIDLGHFRLTKILPVAAGLGGGSADAAAALRLLAGANPGALDDSALVEIAALLGSDVTACLQSRPALITGRGEKVTAIHGMPACGVVLVNPGLPLTAASVYSALHAAPLSGGETCAAVPDFAGSFERVIEYAAPRGNHLEAAALQLAPVIGEVLAPLRRVPGARLVQLAGSGPTCFALFTTEDEAKSAAASLKAGHSPWWVAATRLEVRAD